MEAAISNGTFIAFLVQMHLAIQLPAAEIHLMFQDKLMIKISCWIHLSELQNSNPNPRIGYIKVRW